MKFAQLLSILLISALPMLAHADTPGRHPSYLHALTFLREARWDLNNRPGDPNVTQQEQIAIQELDIIIHLTKKAAWRDDKDLDDAPNWSEQNNQRGRLHRAIQLIDNAYVDVTQPEDNPDNAILRDQIVSHMSRATQAIKQAIQNIENPA